MSKTACTSKRTKLACSIAASILLAASGASQALNILLTNDDGWDSAGITATRSALIAAGHNVTLVGPLVNQSGKGGSMIADNGVTVAVVQSGGPGSNVWSVNSTPTDAVRAAFGNAAGGVLPAGVKPDLVISGINNGQNLAMTGSWGSGTVNAALQGLSQGVPSIAVSAERLLSASDADTIAAMPAVANFVVRLVDRLQQTAMGGQLLPAGTMLNVNYPVFNAAAGRPGSVQGVKVTNLATKSNIEFVWVGTPASTGTMTAGLDFGFYFSPVPDPIVNSDKAAFKAGFVTVTPMDGDMTAKSKPGTTFSSIQWRINGLAP
jgi:5'/3'-nucleotidase SurE